MNLRDLAEVACTLAWYGPDVHGVGSRGAGPLEDYWKSFRFRCHLWARALDELESTHRDNRSLDRLRINTQGNELLEEILVSELLTRVVSAILCRPLAAPRGGSGTLRTLAWRSVTEHTLLRHRAMACCRTWATTVPELLRQQRLQRRLERWMDLMISPLASEGDAAEMAANRGRCLEFAREGAFLTVPGEDVALFCLHAHALKLAVPNRTVSNATRIAAHAMLAESALALVPSALFSRNGLVKPRLQRMIEKF